MIELVNCSPATDSSSELSLRKPKIQAYASPQDRGFPQDYILADSSSPLPRPLMSAQGGMRMRTVGWANWTVAKCPRFCSACPVSCDIRPAVGVHLTSHTATNTISQFQGAHRAASPKWPDATKSIPKLICVLHLRRLRVQCHVPAVPSPARRSCPSHPAPRPPSSGLLCWLPFLCLTLSNATCVPFAISFLFSARLMRRLEASSLDACRTSKRCAASSEADACLSLY